MDVGTYPLSLYIINNWLPFMKSDYQQNKSSCWRSHSSMQSLVKKRRIWWLSAKFKTCWDSNFMSYILKNKTLILKEKIERKILCRFRKMSNYCRSYLETQLANNLQIKISQILSDYRILISIMDTSFKQKTEGNQRAMARYLIETKASTTKK